MRDMLDDAPELSGRDERVAVAMVVDTRRSAPRPLGSRLYVTESGEMRGSVSGGCVESDVVLRAQEVLRDNTPTLVQYGITDDDAFDVGLPCGGATARPPAGVAFGRRPAVRRRDRGVHRPVRRRRGGARAAGRRRRRAP